MDAQLNRYGGPNFEQAPLNRPRVPIHNNNRDGYAQQYIPTNTAAAYSPNTANLGSPMEANQTVGNGFFTAPNRYVTGALTRQLSPTFADHWSQPRIVWNSLSPAEQQIAVNALRFEASHVVSVTIRQNFINQLNRIDHGLAQRVAQVLVDVTVPGPDSTYYNNNKTAYLSIFSNPLPTILGLNLGILVSVYSNQSMAQATSLSKQFADLGLFVSVVAEVEAPGVTSHTLKPMLSSSTGSSSPLVRRASLSMGPRPCILYIALSKSFKMDMPLANLSALWAVAVSRFRSLGSWKRLEFT